MREGRTTRGRLAATLSRAALAAAAAALLAVPAAAQEEGGRYLAEAPEQFRLGATGSALLWDEAATRSPSDGSLWGVDVERLLFRYASVRLGVGYGTGSVRNAARSADVRTYLFEVAVGPRLALPALREAGLVPFGTVGLGTVVHDPTEDGLVSRSQNAFSWGVGVEYRLLRRLGLRAEWRSYSVDLENVFDAADRTGESRDADRLQASVFWTF